MARSPELRRIVGAMTERPWVGFVSPLADALGVQHAGALYHDGCYVADCIGSSNESADLSAIVTLASHADALVALVGAVERIYELGPQPMTPRQAEAFSALYRALAAVHAIPEKP